MPHSTGVLCSIFGRLEIRLSNAISHVYILKWRGGCGALLAPPQSHEDVPPPLHGDAPSLSCEDVHLDQVEHLMSEMIGALQLITGSNATPVCQGLLLERLRALGDGEAYHWWVIVEHGTTPERVDWEFFLEPFQRKFMGEQHLEARRCEFMDLV
ncbi:hypothetical protein GOBAR_DD09913 [Gossypium barbadense]|nr:hypothetical protein GOBAR_DD09913 [Gossypium barbadense]